MKSMSFFHLQSFFVILIFLFLVFFFRYFYFSIDHFSNSDFYLNNTPQDLIDANQTINDRTQQCNAYFQDNSFCQLDQDSNKCVCKYQKDAVKYSFSSPPSCCDRLCSLLPPEKCMNPTVEDKKLQYYCNVGGMCLPRDATIRENRISANNCGTDPLNNQLLLPFMTKEECESSVDVCDIHNNKKLTESERKASCLNDVRCGYCTNQFNVGKCISGTTSGPLNLQKYYYCQPSRTQSDYQYLYGDHAEALNITQFKK